LGERLRRFTSRITNGRFLEPEDFEHGATLTIVYRILRVRLVAFSNCERQQPGVYPFERFKRLRMRHQ
jgi:hypothetical protein